MIESYIDGVKGVLVLHAYVFLQCDYYNRGHLNKVDQSDYRKITIHTTHEDRGPKFPYNVRTKEVTNRVLKGGFQCLFLT